jgi:hypothetical protein
MVEILSVSKKKTREKQARKKAEWKELLPFPLCLFLSVFPAPFFERRGSRPDGLFYVSCEFL